VRRLAVLAVVLATAAAAAAPALAASDTSVTDISDEVMCVVCGVPLNVAGGPQADRERAYIQDLVDQGKSKSEIKAELVTTYGEDVLADPGSDGIAVTTWLVPLLLVLAALAGLVIVVPRWRRNRLASERAAAAGQGPAAPPPLDEADAQRLDEDLARYR
jgi:cytochrome c-type biogenesis protein CcmH/NrfF